MKLFARRVAAVCVSAAVLSLTARAGVPGALDKAPTDAVLVIATPSLNQLDKQAGQLLAAMGLPQISTPSQLLQIANLRNGLNMEGSAAVVVLPGDPNGAQEPPIIVLLPVTDYGALLGNFGVKPAGAGALDSLNMAGSDVFAKDVGGGYAALSPTEAVLAAFAGKGGNLEAYKAALGAAGAAVADKAEILAVANVAAMGPYMDAWSAGVKEGMAAAGGPDPKQMEAASKVMDDLFKTLKRDGRTLALGIDAGATGVAFDMAAMFKEGSETAKTLTGPGAASSLMKRLPDQPYILAAAVDYAHPAARDLISKMTAIGDQMGGMGMMGGIDVTKMLGVMTGQATAIYPNPAGPMAGVLANTVTFIASKDPKAVLAQTKQMLQGLGGDKAPAKFTATFTDNEAQVNGVAADGYALALTPGNDPVSMQLMQMMSIFYGPAGMSGYLAATDGGVYQTMSKNQALLKSALDAGKGGSLADDAMIKQVSERLPQGRLAEGYVGIRTILEQAMPFMQMFLPVQIDLPADLPPVAGGVAVDSGALRATGVVPAQVLKLGGTVFQEIQKLSQPGGDMGNDQPPQGDGKPRF